jgi:hypothetical protein
MDGNWFQVIIVLAEVVPLIFLLLFVIKEIIRNRMIAKRKEVVRSRYERMKESARKRKKEERQKIKEHQIPLFYRVMHLRKKGGFEKPK